MAMRKLMIGLTAALAAGLGGCVTAPGYYGGGTVAYSDYPVYYGHDRLEYTSVHIGISVPVYPHLVLIPGYPVYYAPGLSVNYFFYDGVYWVYHHDNWYMSTWFNGPWIYVSPVSVPLFILRVPVRYYTSPPGYFRGWRRDAPPHWGEHWGPQWQRQRHGWDNWNRRAVPKPAPLPHYQREYGGSRYPDPARQTQLRRERYRYQPHDSAGRQLYLERERRREQGSPPGRSPARPEQQRRPQVVPPSRQRPQVEQPQYRMPQERRAPTIQRPGYPSPEPASPRYRIPGQDRAPGSRERPATPQRQDRRDQQSPSRGQRDQSQGRQDRRDTQRGQGRDRQDSGSGRSRQDEQRSPDRFGP